MTIGTTRPVVVTEKKDFYGYPYWVVECEMDGCDHSSFWDSERAVKLFLESLSAVQVEWKKE